MKKLGLLISFVFIILFIAACGGSGSDSEGEGAAEGESETTKVESGDEDATELTFWTFQGIHVPFYEDAVETWNEENPDRPIDLSAEVFPFDEMHNNLLVSLQSGEGAPDIADIEINRFPNFLQGDIQLEPLNDIIEPEIDNFVESRLNVYAKDGNYYGAPTHVGASVMFYNTAILEEAGVDPDEIETWDDYVEAGETVVEETGTPMTTYEDVSQWSFVQMISQQSSDVFDVNGDVILDNQTNIDTLQFIHDTIYDQEIAETTPGGSHAEEEYFGFMNQGGAASVNMPLWYASRFLEHMPDLKGDMIIRPMPAFEEGGNRTAGMGGTGTSVTKQSENTELAMDFLEHAKISEEGNLKIWTELGFDPPRHDVWDDEVMQEDNEFYQYFGDDIFDTLLDIRDEVADINITEETPLARDLIESQVMPSVISSEDGTSPQEALEEAAERLRSEQE
ncbi:ABC transporter substrate-binding protein [Alteribacillus sp. HJP-4]|uniref:ABC transporter substrate-binding protein n=1 Tax=Alteribacillus sp. HJP-4 TaxID=2775394 RepID=UPI0035CCE257